MSSTPSKRLSVSLVTPNYNGDAFLEQTFQSVAQQKLDGLEYIFVDGASTDRSMQIANDFRDLISITICEPDNGHADALNKGFDASSGDIMGWINSDDVLLPGCLETVRRVFETFPEIEWITGRASTMNERGELVDVRPVRPWSRRRFLGGDHLWIQQESTFWRRGLWDKAGASLDTAFDVANDFELWARFFRHADLYTVDRMLGCFRVREGQRSTSFRARYLEEVNDILCRELDQLPLERRQLLNDTLMVKPTMLSATALRTQQARLSIDDLPFITSHSLRTGELEPESLQVSGLEDNKDELDDTGRVFSDWQKTLSRNWRFFGGVGLIGCGLGLAAKLNPELPNQFIYSSLTALSLASIAAIAIKVRRIVRRLEQAVQRAFSGRACAELRIQSLEIAIDRIASEVNKTNYEKDDTKR